MYFTFIKMVIVYLLVRFFIVDIFELIASIQGNFCSSMFEAQKKNLCSTTLSGWNLKSTANTSSLNVLTILALIFTIVSIPLFHYFRSILRKQKNIAESLEFSQDKFSILLENLPEWIYF